MKTKFYVISWSFPRIKQQFWIVDCLGFSTEWIEVYMSYRVDARVGHFSTHFVTFVTSTAFLF